LRGTTLEHIQTETYQTHQTLPLPVLEEMSKMQTGDCTFDEVRNIIHYLRLEQHITAEFIVRRDKQQYFCHSNSNDNNISIITMIRALVKKKKKEKDLCTVAVKRFESLLVITFLLLFLFSIEKLKPRRI